MKYLYVKYIKLFLSIVCMKFILLVFHTKENLAKHRFNYFFNGSKNHFYYITYFIDDKINILINTLINTMS